jgi:hypothetical protein
MFSPSMFISGMRNNDEEGIIKKIIMGMPKENGLKIDV